MVWRLPPHSLQQSTSCLILLLFRLSRHGNLLLSVKCLIQIWQLLRFLLSICDLEVRLISSSPKFLPLLAEAQHLLSPLLQFFLSPVPTISPQWFDLLLFLFLEIALEFLTGSEVGSNQLTFRLFPLLSLNFFSQAPSDCF